MKFKFPVDPNEICQTLYNSETISSRCVGYCNFHRAYVTSQQMKTKRCLEKQCNAFIKNSVHQFWILREQKKAEKKKRKEIELKKFSSTPIRTLEPLETLVFSDEVKIRYICINLKINGLADKELNSSKGLNSEVSQIGAVMLDENFNYLSEFSIFIKPVYSSISDESIVHADTFTTAFYKFYCWAGNENDKITTFCWSDSDYKQLWDEIYIKAKNHNEYRNFLRTFIDLQAIFKSILKTKKAISFSEALKVCHVRFKDQQQTAISNALNIARILYKLKPLEKYEVDFVPLWKYIETDLAKTFYAVNSLENDFTTNFALFVPNEIREKFARKENNVKLKKNSTIYGSLRILNLVKFSIRMWFSHDMNVYWR